MLAPIHTPPPPPGPSHLVNDLTTTSTDSHILSDSYLIVLQDHLNDDEIAQHHAQVDQVHRADMRMRHLKQQDVVGDAVHDFVNAVETKYHGIKHKFHVGRKGNKRARKALKGYSGKFTPETLDAIRAMKDVKYVERDSIVYAQELEIGAPWVSIEQALSGQGRCADCAFGSWGRSFHRVSHVSLTASSSVSVLSTVTSTTRRAVKELTPMSLTRERGIRRRASSEGKS